MINFMLHLAICDKSLNDTEQMEKYLENIKFFNFDYEVFENAKELYKYQTQHHENFDIYIKHRIGRHVRLGSGQKIT